VEDTLRRICSSYGVGCECVVTPTSIVMSVFTERLSDEDKGYVFVRRIKERTIDLHRIELANSLSRTIEDKQLSYGEAMKRIKEIEKIPYFTFLERLLAASLTGFVFVLLLKGSIIEALIALTIVVVIYCLTEAISKIGVFSFFQLFISGITAGGMCVLTKRFYPALNLDVTIIGSIIVFFPGIAITNGIRDILYGDLLSSISRIAEAFLVVAALGAGVAVSLTLNTYL
jgi:uncharacterized membrane protein YjjP (DUF1212 family)